MSEEEGMAGTDRIITAAAEVLAFAFGFSFGVALSLVERQLPQPTQTVTLKETTETAEGTTTFASYKAFY